MSNTDFLGRAINIVKNAIEQDVARNYAQASQLYIQSLDLFMLALKWEKNANTKNTIREKTAEYMERAEILKKHLAEADQGNKRKATAIGSNGKAPGTKGKSVLRPF